MHFNFLNKIVIDILILFAHDKKLKSMYESTPIERVIGEIKAKGIKIISPNIAKSIKTI